MVTVGVEGGYEGDGLAGERAVCNEWESRRLMEMCGEEGADVSTVRVWEVSSEPWRPTRSSLRASWACREFWSLTT